MSKGIVQIQSSSISPGQILRSVKIQMLMLLSNKNKCFSYPEKSYPGPSLKVFCLKGNNKSKSVSKRAVQGRSWPVIPINMYKKYAFSKWAVK